MKKECLGYHGGGITKKGVVNSFVNSFETDALSIQGRFYFPDPSVNDPSLLNACFAHFICP